MRRLRVILVLSAVLLLSAGTFWLHYRTGPTRTYQITDLGVTGGADNSQGTAINNAGQVTGWLFYNNPQGPFYIHAFLWQNGRMTDLGTLPGLPRCSGTALNAQGVVVGYSEAVRRRQTSGGAAHTPGVGFIDRSGRMTRVPTLPGYPIGDATAVNDQGQIAGTARPATDGSSRAFLFQNGSVRDLGTLGALDGLKDQVGSYANGINTGGQITGASEASGGEVEMRHAFLYSQGKMTDLGTLPGYQNSYATGLNSRGQVVGGADTLIPFLRFLNARPSSGGARPDVPRRPFLSENGRMTDLNALLPAHSGWVLEEAHGINDRGQIVGSGKHNGQTRAFVLMPVGAK